MSNPINPGSVDALLNAVAAGGNVALVICIWYIVKAVQVLTRLEKAIDALLYRIGFQLTEAGDVLPVAQKRREG